MVAEASLLRNQLLDIFNRSVGREVDGWGKLLDGLLGSYAGEDELVRLLPCGINQWIVIRQWHR